MRALLLALTALSAQAATYYVTVAGLGGEPEYDQRFQGWAHDLDKLLKASPDAKVTTLTGAQATRAQFQSTLQQIARDASKDDALVLMIIGHGSFDGQDYKVNLPGPDISAAEIGALLDRIAARQLVVNTTSASGASFAVLKKENRAIIAATKSGTEKNATLFARYWVEALRDPSADIDKNESISALEAFRYAEQKTAKFFESQNRLATEHAVLEDTGKGEPTRAPSPQNGEGLLASRITLIRLGASQAVVGRHPALVKRKQELEEQIDSLKYQKAAIPVSEYRQKLTALLTELAKVQAELDK
ncbi:MAG: hypothetical protein JSU00_19120 [Acidobacteria bacterium]|nr:hypothetical protein [Acidobacteriota bacterium]